MGATCRHGVTRGWWIRNFFERDHGVTVPATDGKHRCDAPAYQHGGQGMSKRAKGLQPRGKNKHNARLEKDTFNLGE